MWAADRKLGVDGGCGEDGAPAHGLLSWLRPQVWAAPAPALLGTRRRVGGRSGPGSRWPQRARPCPQARHFPPNPLPQLQQEPLPAATRPVSGQRPLLGVGAQPCPQPPSPQWRVCRGRVEGPRGDTAVFLPHLSVPCSAQAPGFQSLP